MDIEETTPKQEKTYNLAVTNSELIRFRHALMMYVDAGTSGDVERPSSLCTGEARVLLDNIHKTITK